MKTPEEIKQGLEAIAETDIAARAEKVARLVGVYRYFEDVATDALAYIQQLEESEKRCRELLEIAYGKLQKAYRELDDVENCTNCLYGDGSDDYCRDCRWFDDENDILKWVSKIEQPKLDDCSNCDPFDV